MQSDLRLRDRKTVRRLMNAERIRAIKRHKWFYYFLVPAVVFYLVFHYAPMYGIIMAFQDFNPLLGFAKSPFVGLKHFEKIIAGSSNIHRIIFNTVKISLLKILFGFPAPIILALMFNEVRHTVFKRAAQTISYLPHFLSWVIIASMVQMLLHPSAGLINKIILFLGGESIYFLTNDVWFITTLIVSGIWASVGWSSIIYIAAITGLDPQMYEAAVVEGANRFQQMRYITVPCLMPVIAILFVQGMGGILDAGFDQIFNLYNQMVYDVADVIDTYIYRVGLQNFDYSFSTAVGLFKTVIGVVLIVITNTAVKRMGQEGLF